MDLPTVPLVVERSFYIGNAVYGILYGVQLTLCMQSIHYIRKIHSPIRRKQFYICYSLALVLMNSIGLGCNTLYGQFVWIEQRSSSPGGPAEYFLANTTWWVNTFGTCSALVANLMSDGLLLYRCYVILGQSMWVIVFPIHIFLASTALGILTTSLSALPNNFIFSGQVAQFAVAWMSISVSFNIVVTLIISLRLLHARYRMRKNAPKEDIEIYTSVVAILVESAFPLALSGLVAAIFYGKGHPAAFALTVVWGNFVGISPQLIILRVARGRAWSQHTMSQQKSAIRFQTQGSESTVTT